MSFYRYLGRICESWQGNRTARRAKKRRQQPRLTFIRPRLEYLEDRIVLDVGLGGYLTQLTSSGVNSTIDSFATGLAASSLNQQTQLPIITGDNGLLLSQVLGVSSNPSSFSSNFSKSIDNTLSNISNSDQTQVLNAFTTGGGSAAEPVLQTELGNGFTVSEADNNGIVITYTKDVSGTNQVPSFQDSSSSDLFGANLSNLTLSNVNLSGSATETLPPNSIFTITFGVDSQGFFVGPNPNNAALFSSPGFSASLQLSGSVNIGKAGVFTASVSIGNTGDPGPGTINLSDIDLTLTKNIYSSDFSDGSKLSNDATFQIGSGSANVVGNFSANVLGVNLVSWQPSMSWTFDNGVAQAASVTIPTAPVESQSKVDPIV